MNSNDKQTVACLRELTHRIQQGRPLPTDVVAAIRELALSLGKADDAPWPGNQDIEVMGAEVGRLIGAFQIVVELFADAEHADESVVSERACAERLGIPQQQVRRAVEEVEDFFPRYFAKYGYSPEHTPPFDSRDEGDVVARGLDGWGQVVERIPRTGVRLCRPAGFWMLTLIQAKPA